MMARMLLMMLALRSIPDDSHPNCRCTKIAHVSLVPLLGVAGAIAATDHSNKNQTSNDEQ